MFFESQIRVFLTVGFRSVFFAGRPDSGSGSTPPEPATGHALIYSDDKLIILTFKSKYIIDVIC